MPPSPIERSSGEACNCAKELWVGFFTPTTGSPMRGGGYAGEPQNNQLTKRPIADVHASSSLRVLNFSVKS